MSGGECIRRVGGVVLGSMLGCLVAAALFAPSPKVAMTVNETSTIKFMDAWLEAYRIGIRATAVALDWSALEPTPGKYELLWPATAAAFYPAQGATIGLVLRDLNTNRDERPVDLRGRPFSDDELFRRWKGMATAVLGAMKSVKFDWIAVGNEVDASLGTDDAKIKDYAKFLGRAFAFIHTERPGVRVGTPLTFDGIRQHPESYAPILTAGDVAMVNYYFQGGATRDPTKFLPKDLNVMRDFAGKRPLYITEAGAPSGTIAGSSEAAQASFVTEMIREARQRGIPYVHFNWMNDMGDAAATRTAGYYGVADKPFQDFLATLGFRHPDGRPKPAWAALKSGIAGNVD